MKSWKISLVGMVALVMFCVMLWILPMNAYDAPDVTPPETSISTDVDTPEAITPIIVPSMNVPPLVFYPRPEMPQAPVDNPEPPIPGIIDGDYVIVDVKFYNNAQEGFNQVDGREYLDDIAALLKKHAPDNLLISAGCAMSYTEGGAGKKGVYAYTNNCFGIRATSGWDGWVFARNTGKVYINWETAIKHGGEDLFKAYPTMEDSVKDYIAHMTGSYYNAVLGMTSEADYFTYVLSKGYGEAHMLETWLYIVNLYDLAQYNTD